MLTTVTRKVSPTLGDCELTHLEREPIDVPRAIAQHAAYETLLADLGARVISLPPLDGHPDAVFVEDAAVVVNEIAVVTRPGAASRRGETDSIAAALEPHRPVVRIEAPATVEGGDVLRLGRDVFVGLTARTNEAGAEALGRALAPHGYRVRAVPAEGCLHLKSAVADLGGGAILVNPAWVDPDVFGAARVLVVDESEPWAANALRLRDTVVFSAAYPRTARRLQRERIALRVVDVSEMHKAEAGLTCMSLVFRG